MLGGHYWEIVISGHNTHELTAAVVVNTRPVEGQVSQHSCMMQEGVHKPSSPTEEMMRGDGHSERSLFSLVIWPMLNGFFSNGSCYSHGYMTAPSGLRGYKNQKPKKGRTQS